MWVRVLPIILPEQVHEVRVRPAAGQCGAVDVAPKFLIRNRWIFSADLRDKAVSELGAEVVF